jgi:hypothetical protein
VGEVLLLEAGDIVPVDAVLIVNTSDVCVDESHMTVGMYTVEFIQHTALQRARLKPLCITMK